MVCGCLGIVQVAWYSQTDAHVRSPHAYMAAYAACDVYGPYVHMGHTEVGQGAVPLLSCGSDYPSCRDKNNGYDGRRPYRHSTTG